MKSAVARKNRQFTDHDGWTHVLKGPRAASKVGELSQQGPDVKIDALPEAADIARIQHGYDKIWLNTSCRQQLEDILTREILQSDHLRICNCVCLGLGSITNGRTASRHQFAALRWMLSLLKSRFIIKEIIFQDPAFNAADVAHFHHLGFQVRQHPFALEAIRSTTFLFAPHLERDLYATALRTVTPALCVGNDVCVHVDSWQMNEMEKAQSLLDGSVMSAFDRSTESLAMPAYDLDPWCYFTRIYWQKPHMNISNHFGDQA